MSGSTPDLGWIPSWMTYSVDVGLVLVLTYLMLLVIGERRTLWMVRGFIIVMLASVASQQLELYLLSFVLEKLVIGAAVAMAVIFQSDLRKFLEQVGRGELLEIFRPSQRSLPKPDSVIDEIVDAVKELSQNRTGALIILETSGPLDERDVAVPGVGLNAEISKELLQTIFQTSTLLHDGAVHIRGSRILAAGTILPLSDRKASRQLGTRHRAAMGLAERVENCLCIVVSEETGSISVAEGRTLNRPLTSAKLKELLEEKFSPSVEREAVVGPKLGELSRQIGDRGWVLFKRFFRKSPPSSSEKRDEQSRMR